MRVPFFDLAFGRRRRRSAPQEATARGDAPRVVVVGTPNVGKSVLFHRLTGAYVTVSNYPGTTVEVARGRARFGGRQVEVVDTPGLHSLRTLSDEERVARRLLLEEPAMVVLHVVDAKNLERMLPFTFQLLEAGLPVVLVANMIDEAERAGLRIDVEGLEQSLGIPVVGTVAVSGRGIPRLRALLDERCRERAHDRVAV
ncbi:MAG TPA: FeoB small GTPase domain-containing protein [Chthonomonadales bacterium]|nr:FeoB small GTPase domain-containing protein [Chthonomonadales bacterium]